MFFHQLRDDFVLALELVAQRGDGAVEAVLGGGVLALEGDGSVLEELLLSEIEQRGGEPVLVADVRDRGHGRSGDAEGWRPSRQAYSSCGTFAWRDSCRVVV
jgi:hypothetical protein